MDRLTYYEWITDTTVDDGVERILIAPAKFWPFQAHQL
jgi:hypothetical protein